MNRSILTSKSELARVAKPSRALLNYEKLYKNNLGSKVTTKPAILEKRVDRKRDNFTHADLMASVENSHRA